VKAPARKVRCAVYTRVSTDERLDMEFNSLDAQREAALSYIASQKHEGWFLVGDRYDDGGFSGGTMERPALQRLLRDVESGVVDVIVVYKVDRLSRSLTDFARIVEVFEKNKTSFVSITQQFNTTTSMGIRALARAHRWKQLIENGTYRSAAGIAEAEGVTRSFVNRLLRLTLLAPDIVEAILEGRQPQGMQLEELTGTISSGWVEQRDVLLSGAA
jgi:hypothetical protein